MAVQANAKVMMSVESWSRTPYQVPRAYVHSCDLELSANEVFVLGCFLVDCGCVRFAEFEMNAS